MAGFLQSAGVWIDAGESSPVRQTPRLARADAPEATLAWAIPTGLPATALAFLGQDAPQSRRPPRRALLSDGPTPVQPDLYLTPGGELLPMLQDSPPPRRPPTGRPRDEAAGQWPYVILLDSTLWGWGGQDPRPTPRPTSTRQAEGTAPRPYLIVEDPGTLAAFQPADSRRPGPPPRPPPGGPQGAPGGDWPPLPILDVSPWEAGMASQPPPPRLPPRRVGSAPEGDAPASYWGTFFTADAFGWAGVTAQQLQPQPRPPLRRPEGSPGHLTDPSLVLPEPPSGWMQPPPPPRSDILRRTPQRVEAEQTPLWMGDDVGIIIVSGPYWTSAALVYCPGASAAAIWVG